MGTRETIGWNLRKLRVEQGLSQERLALEAGIDRSYVGRVERGEENVTIDTLEALSNVLQVPVGRLFAELGPDEDRPLPMRAGRKRKDSTSK
ncbi:helix-turn-helix domain-containing protein [Ciceribacter selenitireducens]|uniref:helix-turn-helix domain-containing protein n=1 Tax=Ciceribacter selenitireducens TaxID=448181 RepID=UPI000E209D54|nr:helix-turn-helix transcriptional regulator [Ciceribacter selenitireducens]